MRVFRNSRGKKGSLSLSINAIVVLILAITMLGLGLGFMRNMFGGVSKQFTDITDQVQKDMVDRLKESGKKVVLSTYEVKMKQSSKQTIYLAIRNDLDSPGADENFEIKKDTIQAVGSASCIADGDIALITNNKISGGESKVVPIILSTDANDKGTCEISIVVEDETNAVYGREDFLITVG